MSENIENLMGKRICQMRKEKGLTMEELGSMVGVNKSAVNKWEKGIVCNIKRTTIADMAKIFDCSPVWLMGYDPETKIGKLQQFSIDASLEGERDANLLINFHKLTDRDKDVIENMVDTLLRSYD